MRVLVTGGAGYVGSALVPKLLSSGYDVNVLDLYLFGEETLARARHIAKGGGQLFEIKGDIRDHDSVNLAVAGCDAVIHLACVSNDPCFELDPELSRSVDFGSFRPLIQAAKDAGVKRFIYASSSSVYGLKGEEEVTEDLPLDPLTRYSQCKVDCEEILNLEREPGFVTTILRPATVCGWSPRLRLDVVVNALTASAFFKKMITVDGGDQMRSSLHMEDMVEVYSHLLDLPDEMVDGKTWNVSCANATVMHMAEMIREAISSKIEVKPVKDPRSYRISSKAIGNDIGFEPAYTIVDAIDDLQIAFMKGLVENPDDDRYHNIRRMQRMKLA